MMRQKSCVDKIRTYSKGSGGYKTAKLDYSSSSVAVSSGEKLVSGRKGRTKKEVAMMRQKSCVDKIRTYSKGSGGYKTAKYASVQTKLFLEVLYVTTLDI
ncbi:hypothetical protein DY000_02053849 [Brassica cretica]|uniref:Uncharacterized protein n=1 Tax=Brassica cretica TaxID=69181 RepID=A0ABQ7A6V2_BRACR|nr:hypothetical protein DY000_02053849 [Brassica cretica]